MSNIFSMPLWLSLLAFTAGWMTAKFASFVSTRANKNDVPEHHREIRALEAQLRIARKEAQEGHDKLAESTLKLDTLRGSLESMEETSQFHVEELEKARHVVNQETAKVTELRRELTDRAEETIRAQVSARNSETELSLLKASSDLDLARNEPDEEDEEEEDLIADLGLFDEDLSDESDQPFCWPTEAAVEEEDTAERLRPRPEGISDC